MDITELRQEAGLNPELMGTFANSLRNAIETRFNTYEITPEEVDLLIYAASTNSYDNGAVLLQGDFQLDDVRWKWQEENYHHRTYRGQEVWTGRDTYAVIEAQRSVIASSHETLVKDFVRIHDGTITSLERLRDSHYAQLLAVLSHAPMYFASGHSSNCAKRLEHCQAFGIRFENADTDTKVIHVTVAAVMPNPEAAAEAADQRTHAADAATYILDTNASWAERVLGLPPQMEAELGTIRAKDNIVYIEAAIPPEKSP